MTRGRLRQLALVLLAAVTVRAELAAPAFSVASLRAVSHCVAHRGRPVSTADAARCCNVGAPGDEHATLAAGGMPVAPATALLGPLPTGSIPAVPGPRAAHLEPLPRDTGPPRFLRLRTLQI